MKFELWFPVWPYLENQGFGADPARYAQYGYKGHNGNDLRVFTGQVCWAPFDGTVVFTGQEYNGGWGVEVVSDYEEQGVRYKALFYHLIPSIPVTAGQKVSCGDVVGYCDNTGAATTGTHLHFGLKRVRFDTSQGVWVTLDKENGYYGAIDPSPFWNWRPARDAQIMRKMIELLREFLLKVGKK